MNDMHTLAFPQALGTGIVVQVRPHMSNSGESDTHAPNPTPCVTDSGETDNPTSHLTHHVSNSAETDIQHLNPEPQMSNSPESDIQTPNPIPCVTDSGETDNCASVSALHVTDSPETDILTPVSAPCMTDSGESDMWRAIHAFLDGYERVLSRFREDSLVAAMRRAQHGGSFDFPDWAAGLFDLYDALHEASDGAIDPCVGEDLTRLGYGPAYTFAAQPDAGERVSAVHGRPTWSGSVERHGCTLVTRGPVSLDFGACGKGYAVDLIASLLRNGGCAAKHDGTYGSERDMKHLSAVNPTVGSRTAGTAQADHANGSGRISNSSADFAADSAFVIDAGGDLLVHLQSSDRASRQNGTTRTTTASHTSSTPPTPPLRIALEHPTDTTQAIGVAEIASGALCASAPSRRHWGEQAGMKLHHLLNAIDGLPADNIAAAWTYVREQDTVFPCATADGLATALFVTPPDRLRARFRFECAFIDANGMAHASRDFPATLFLA